VPSALLAMLQRGDREAGVLRVPLYIVTVARLILRLLEATPTFVYHPCSGIISCTRSKRGRC
jgi:hypothetical protein